MTDTTKKIRESIETKKLEVNFVSGGHRALVELSKSHGDFIEKSRQELQGLISENKLTVEVGNYVLGWLGRSGKTISDYVNIVKMHVDIKSGELIGLDSALKMIQTSEPETVVDAEKPEDVHPRVEVEALATITEEASDVVENSLSSVEETYVLPVVTKKTLKSSKKSKSRPDETQNIVGETVKRLKTARAKKTRNQ